MSKAKEITRELDPKSVRSPLVQRAIFGHQSVSTPDLIERVWQMGVHVGYMRPESDHKLRCNSVYGKSHLRGILFS